MDVNRDARGKAAKQSTTEAGQTDARPRFLRHEQGSTPAPTRWVTHVLYALGMGLALGPLSVVVILGWYLFGGWGVMVLGVVYATALFMGTEMQQARNPEHPLIGWLALGVALSLPLAVFGLELQLGWWEGVASYQHWLFNWGSGWWMPELTLFGSALVLLLRYRQPVLMAPMILLGWKWAVLYTPVTWGNMAWLSLGWGLLCFVVGLGIDLMSRSRRDFAAWWYGIALAIVWFIYLFNYIDVLRGVGFLLLSVVTLLIGLIIHRRVFVFVGVLGIVAYAGWLALDAFEDSWVFSLFLTVIGTVLIVVGVYWTKLEQGLSRALAPRLPRWWPQRWIGR